MKNLATWLVEDKVIFTSLIGDLTIEDFTKLDNDIIPLFKASSSQTIHMLADISLMTSMPGVFAMTKLQYITHPKIGYFITQSRNPVEKFIGSTVGQILKTKYRFIDTLDDGIQFLATLDDSLPSVEEMHARVESLRNEFVAQGATI